MTRLFRLRTGLAIGTGIVALAAWTFQGTSPGPTRDAQAVTTHAATAHDRSAPIAAAKITTPAGAGGVRWYEFRVADKNRAVQLRRQGTYAPDGMYRWMGSAAMDKLGNLVVGYSYGGGGAFAGQRAAGRLANDPTGVLAQREVVLAEGEAAQTNTLRWEDYTQTAVDPSDDCTVWYVGDYFRKDATSYSSRIGAFRMKGCT